MRTVIDPVELFRRCPGRWTEAELQVLQSFDELVMAGIVFRRRARDWRNLAAGLEFVVTEKPRFTGQWDQAKTELRAGLLEIATEGLAEFNNGKSPTSPEEEG
jgi:hypothetical protein